MRYAVAQDRSHTSCTDVRLFDAPRSTRIHCGSTCASLAQRVAVFPSTAFAAAYDEPPTLDAVTGLPCEISGSAAEAAVERVTCAVVSASAATPSMARRMRTGRCERDRRATMAPCVRGN